jgi:hypothetical protein
MYRPRYCRECGQQIERERWRPWHSTGFCDRCAPAFRMDWLTQTAALVTLGGVIGFWVGSCSAVRSTTPSPMLEIKAHTSVTQPGSLSENLAENHSDKPEAPQSKTEPVNPCGALTQKGTLCRRRVKGGGYCWQHEKQGQATSRPATPPGKSANPASQRAEDSSDPRAVKTTSDPNPELKQSGVCGAPTESGKACQRRVEGEGRCRQHQEMQTPSATTSPRPEEANIPSERPSDPQNRSSNPPPAKTTTPPHSQTVEICGAPTRSGKPCQRRVKGGGRCWQHRDL